MNYNKFITGVSQLSAQSAPDVWSRIEQSIQSRTVLSFPRWRMLLVAAVFAGLFVLPTSVLVAHQERQEMYAYLQNTGSTEYVALASVSYY